MPGRVRRFLARIHAARLVGHHRAKRKLATLLGPVEFERTVFVDEFGRRRALLDELLSIPPRSRLSPGAFLWLVRRAAEESYRKTAAAFLAETGCRVSHVAVMGCVRRAAELLRRRELNLPRFH